MKTAFAFAACLAASVVAGDAKAQFDPKAEALFWFDSAYIAKEQAEELKADALASEAVFVQKVAALNSLYNFCANYCEAESTFIHPDTMAAYTACRQAAFWNSGYALLCVQQGDSYYSSGGLDLGTAGEFYEIELYVRAGDEAASAWGLYMAAGDSYHTANHHWKNLATPKIEEAHAELQAWFLGVVGG